MLNEDTVNNKADVLAYQTVGDLLANSETIFQKSLEVIISNFIKIIEIIKKMHNLLSYYYIYLQVVNLLPGGSHVLGLFFIVPQDLKSIQPINIDFYELNQRLNENTCKKNDETWSYILLNYSTVNKK